MNDVGRVPLIDDIAQNITRYGGADGKDYITRPDSPSVLNRILHAWAVLSNQAQAVMFKEDLVEIERSNNHKYNKSEG